MRGGESVAEFAPMSLRCAKPLTDAAALLGGSDPLSRYLLVPLHDIDAWLAGRGEPPQDVLGEAIYLVQQLTRTR
jgi:hypothetical protein